MMTIDGEVVLPETDNAPSLRAIAIGLAREPRFGGQTLKPWNVLAHSFLVADLAEAMVTATYNDTWPVPLDIAVAWARLIGLAHDAPEVIGHDITTHWKTDADRQREANVMNRICGAWGLDARMEFTGDLGERVKACDTRAMWAEGWLLMPPQWRLEDAVVEPSIAALAMTRHWIACAQVLPQWMIVGSHWPAEYERQVTHLLEAIRSYFNGRGPA